MANKKDWAVLAYLVGDDKGESGRLDDAIAAELNAMCAAADFSRMSLAFQVDFLRRGKTIRVSLTDPPADRETMARDNPVARMIGNAVEEDRAAKSMITGGRVERLRTFRRHPAPTVSGRVIQSIQAGLRKLVATVADQADDNAADKNVLEDFLKFAQETCPAERYFLYFFGHSAGPLGLFYDAASMGMEPSSLRLNDLADSLERGLVRADIVLFRDCFMSTLELAYQLRGCADYLIATQAKAPIAGIWPWREFISILGRESRPKEAAEGIFSALTGFLAHANNRRPFDDVPYALLDTREASRLIAAIKNLVAEMGRVRMGDAARRLACIEAFETARLGTSKSLSLPGGDPALIDVATACSGLVAMHPDVLAQHARALADVLPAVAPKTFSVLGHHKGISLFYKPLTNEQRDESAIISASAAERLADERNYRTLGLCRDTGWGHLATEPLSSSPSILRRLYSALFKR
jgi:hypothetical protein